MGTKKPNKDSEDIRRKLLRKYHAMAGRCGLTAEEKMAINVAHQVESSADLTAHQLIEICEFLQNRINEINGTTGKVQELDKLRKMCIRALCCYIDVKEIETTDKVTYAKHMACRSAKKESFNALTPAELRGVIGYFNRERETIERACGVYGHGDKQVVVLNKITAQA